MRYDADPDERPLRVFEPFVTLRRPRRYEHMLHVVRDAGSLWLGRVKVEIEGQRSCAESWIALGQGRHFGSAAAASRHDPTPFNQDAHDADLAPQTMPYPDFAAAFHVFAESRADARDAIPRGLQELMLGWGLPLHCELRPDIFVLAPVTLPFDEPSLTWLLAAAKLFGTTAAQRR